MDFCRATWPGGDYLPAVWDDWLRDSRGRLLVATVNDAPVGVAHGYFQNSDVVWLEGMRVHPAYRGYGIAGMLNRGLTLYAAQHGARIARLCTESSNVASERHAEKVGFNVIGKFQRLESKKGIRRRPVEVAGSSKFTVSLWRWLENRPEMYEFRAMYSTGWTWHPLTQYSLKRLMTAGQVFLTSGDPEPRSIAILFNKDRRVTIGFAAGTLEGLRDTARYARYLLFRNRSEKVRALIPTTSRLVRILEKSGFTKSGRVLVYAKNLGWDCKEIR